MVKIEGQIIKIAEQQTGNTNLISSILSPENQKFILEVINGVNRILENRNALMQQPNQIVGGNQIRNIENREPIIYNEETTVKNEQEITTNENKQPQQPINEKELIAQLINGLDDLIKFLGDKCTLADLKKLVAENPDQVINLLKMKGVI